MPFKQNTFSGKPLSDEEALHANQIASEIEDDYLLEKLKMKKWKLTNVNTIALDFDGVLSDYAGWKGHDILAPPVTGAIEAIRVYQDAGLFVCIFTARADTPSGTSRIIRWLQDYGLEASRIDQIVITNVKPPAIVYLDDRSWKFVGVFPSSKEILDFKTWKGM